MRFYKRRIEVFLLPLRLKRRLGSEALGVAKSLQGVPVAKIQCHPWSGCIHAQCRKLILSYAGFYDQLCRTSRDDLESSKNKLTLHAIALGDYSDPLQYEKEVTRRNSFFGRNIKRAIKKGYLVEQFLPDQKLFDMAEINTSLWIRSFGPIFSRLSLKDGVSGDVTLSSEVANLTSPPCNLHWEIFFGVFDGPKKGLKRGRLLAYARLHRIGNIVSYDELIGHGQYLCDGIMKLLHLRIVQWLLDAKNLSNHGVDYLVHGTVERGNEGFFFWKKKALFKPYLIELFDFDLPPDFEEERYLMLNPDVRSSHIPPKSHYKIHGKMEGRPYK